MPWWAINIRLKGTKILPKRRVVFKRSITKDGDHDTSVGSHENFENSKDQQILRMYQFRLWVEEKDEPLDNQCFDASKESDGSDHSNNLMKINSYVLLWGVVTERSYSLEEKAVLLDSDGVFVEEVFVKPVCMACSFIFIFVRSPLFNEW